MRAKIYKVLHVVTVKVTCFKLGEIIYPEYGFAISYDYSFL